MTSRKSLIDDLCGSFFLMMCRVNRAEDSVDHDACDAFLFDDAALLFDLFGVDIGDQVAIH